MRETSSRARRLAGRGPALLLALAAIPAWLLGCSDYPDPYTGRCPRIDRLRVRDITATTAEVSWQTERLSVVRIRLEAPERGGPERLVEEHERRNVHRVTLEGLLPDTLYRMAVLGDTLEGLCGEEEQREFSTRPVNDTPGPSPTPVPDPTTPVHP